MSVKVVKFFCFLWNTYVALHVWGARKDGCIYSYFYIFTWTVRWKKGLIMSSCHIPEDASITQQHSRLRCHCRYLWQREASRRVIYFTMVKTIFVTIHIRVQTIVFHNISAINTKVCTKTYFIDKKDVWRDVHICIADGSIQFSPDYNKLVFPRWCMGNIFPLHSGDPSSNLADRYIFLASYSLIDNALLKGFNFIFNAFF